MYNKLGSTHDNISPYTLFDIFIATQRSLANITKKKKEVGTCLLDFFLSYREDLCGYGRTAHNHYYFSSEIFLRLLGSTRPRVQLP